MKRLSLLVAAALVLLAWSTAFGEYYEYTDKDGVVRYTDDPSLIPDDQQEVKTFESIQRDPYQEEMTVDETVSEGATGDTDATAAESDGANPAAAGADREKLDELSAMREKLRQEYEALQAEKSALGPAPPRNAKSVVRKEYNNKVSELNRKIDEYDKRSKEFDEKVKAYNSQIGKK